MKLYRLRHLNLNKIWMFSQRQLEVYLTNYVWTWCYVNPKPVRCLKNESVAMKSKIAKPDRFYPTFYRWLNTGSRTDSSEYYGLYVDLCG